MPSHFKLFKKVRVARLSVLAVLLLTFVGLPAAGQMAGTNLFKELDLLTWASRVILAEEGTTESDMSGWSEEDWTTYCETNDCETWTEEDTSEWTEEEWTEGDTSEWTEEEWEETSECTDSSCEYYNEEWDDYCKENDCEQWNDGEWDQEDQENFYEEGAWEDKPYEDYYYGEEGYYYGEDGYYDETGTFYPYEEGVYEDYYYEAADEEYFMRQQESMKGEVDRLHEELYGIKEIFSKLEGISTPSSRVAASLTELNNLLEKGLTALEQMEAALEDGLSDEDTMSTFWDTMDSLGDAAETHMEVLKDWLEEDSAVASALTDEEMAFITMDHEDEEYSEDEISDYLSEQYSDLVDDVDFESFAGNVSPEEMEKIFRYINDAMMQELLKYMDDEQANDILTKMMNSLTTFGDKGTALMQNTTEVLDVMEGLDFDGVSSSEEVDQLEALYEETKGSLITEASKDDLKEVWADVEDALALGNVSKETMKAYVAELDQLLDENKESLVLEDEVEFYDATLDENAWYFDELAEARDQDIISGDKDSNGNPTGYFRPGDEVTKAEALKMILEGAGLNGSSGNSSDSSADGKWYEEYVKHAEELGLPYQGDWDESCDRGTVAAWTAEIFVGDVAGLDIAEFEYEGTFDDVSDSDPNVEYYQAVYEYGIFTGDDATGDLRPDDLINRAETTKVIMTAVEEVVETAEIEEKLDDVGTLLQRAAVLSKFFSLL
ncbi:MAG: S-layer homology domain-containing protein [Patescibacteria group bacterium]